jgi:hypothetical protein
MLFFFPIWVELGFFLVRSHFWVRAEPKFAHSVFLSRDHDLSQPIFSSCFIVSFPFSHRLSPVFSSLFLSSRLLLTLSDLVISFFVITSSSCLLLVFRDGVGLAVRVSSRYCSNQLVFFRFSLSTFLQPHQILSHLGFLFFVLLIIAPLPPDFFVSLSC